MRTLIAVDCQNDFAKFGALPCEGAERVMSGISHLSRKYDLVVLTQDWHPEGHCSFRSSGGPHPVHCVQGSSGAELHRNLQVPNAQLILRKGCHMFSDSYSAFEDDGGKDTGLAAYLVTHGVEFVDIVGIALKYCVAATAKSAAKRQFVARVLTEYCADTPGDAAPAIWEMTKAGVHVE